VPQMNEGKMMSKSNTALKILNNLKKGASTIETEAAFKAETGDIIPAHVFYRTSDLKAWLERYILTH
jgi:hypothetical protein